MVARALDASCRHRVWAAAALVTAPLVAASALFMEGGPFGPRPRVVGVLGLLYLAGWAGLVASLWRRGVMGGSRAAGGAATGQLVLIGLASLFSLQEMVYGGWDAMPAPVLDVAWPLAHTWMLATGALIVRAGVWRGPSRYAPMLMGAKIPLLLVLSLAGVALAPWLAVGWALTWWTTTAAAQLRQTS